MAGRSYLYGRIAVKVFWLYNHLEFKPYSSSLMRNLKLPKLLTMKFYSCILLLALALSVINVDTSLAQQWTLMSPAKGVEVNIFNENGALSYNVYFKKNIVIERSPLGLDREDKIFSSGLTFVGKRESVLMESYSLLVGKKLKCDNSGNELTLTFENDAKEKMELMFRTYNDGVAFRYHFPLSDNKVQ